MLLLHSVPSYKLYKLLADSPFVELFFGMQPTAQEIENSAFENPIYKC